MAAVRMSDSHLRDPAQLNKRFLLFALGVFAMPASIDGKLEPVIVGAYCFVGQKLESCQ